MSTEVVARTSERISGVARQICGHFYAVAIDG